MILILSACQPKVADAPAESSYVRSEFRPEFKMVASHKQLGSVWAEAGGSQGVQQLYTDVNGQRALFVLRGAHIPALWLDLSQGRLPVALELQHEPLFVSAGRGEAFAAVTGDDGQTPVVLKRTISAAESQWESVVTAASGKWNVQEVTLGDGHPLSEAVWLAGYKEDMKPQGQDPSAVAEIVESAAEPSLMATACRLLPDGAIEAITASIPLQFHQDMQLAPLASGQTLLRVGRDVYYLDADVGSAELVFTAPVGRAAIIAADTTEEAVWWVYLRPRTTGEGTGRVGRVKEPGVLMALTTSGKQLGRISVGMVPVNQVAGDWPRRQGLLAQSSVGVAVVDLQHMSVNWPLRQSGDVPLWLLSSGAQLWAGVHDGVVGISVPGLIRLSPELAASQALGVDLAAQVKPAVERLGWDWTATQVSPLMTVKDQITLFNTADAESTWAEFDWSISGKHASKVMIARSPIPSDLLLREKSNEEVLSHCQSLLSVLGWPGAKRDTSRGMHNQLELQFFFELNPEAGPGLSPGEFRLWITDVSALIMLDAATAPLPEGVLDVSIARKYAARGAVTENVGLEHLAVALLPKAGWLDPAMISNPQLLADPAPSATPCYQVEMLVTGANPMLMQAYVDALSGDAISLTTARYSPLAALSRPESYFGPVGEFVGVVEQQLDSEQGDAVVEEELPEDEVAEEGEGDSAVADHDDTP